MKTGKEGTPPRQTKPVKRFSLKAYDNSHYQRVEKFALRVEMLFADAITDIARAAIKETVKQDKPFAFKDYPKLQSAMRDTTKKMTQQVKVVIENGVKAEWLYSCKKNDALIKYIFKVSKLPKKDLEDMFDRRLDAMAEFQKRKINGMNLSTRVWKYTYQFRKQIEYALDVGLGEGRDADQLSRDVRENLREPNRLFRRVRDKRGNLQLSKAAKAYHPGRGVYRSSYKNAMRLARTEINMAYRESDYQRWKGLDFIIGYEIRRSNHEPLFKCATCEQLTGFYPKAFKFVGWHPQCMCFCVPLMEDFYSKSRRDDRVGRLKAALNGTRAKKYISKQKITRMPENFYTWVKLHIAKQDNWSSTPYFIRDNFRDGRLEKGLNFNPAD